MSVIGRLDEQVEAVMIKPLDSRNRPNRKTASTAEPEPPEPAATEAPAPSLNGPTQSESESSDVEPTAQAELPVWLL